MATENNAELGTLREQVTTLTDLYNRVQGLRQSAQFALRPPLPRSLADTSSLLLKDFQDIKDVKDALCSEKAQQALRVARESKDKDGTELNLNSRRENRKKRRLPSPESPQPYIATKPKSASLFPVVEGQMHLRIQDLPDYIRNFNKTNKSRLHIWLRTKTSSTVPNNPTVVRFTTPDVLTVFISLGFTPDDTVLTVETIAACGPREKKSPHSHSDYSAYRILSQQIAKVVHSDPNVSFQNLMSLLCSYEGLFVDRCTRCQRVLSLEGHFLPVQRVWLESQKWDPRHVNCLED